MAPFEFEGDIENISPRQLEYVGSVLERNGIKSGKVILEPVGKAGDNYGSTVKRFIANKDGEPFKMVGKVAPSIEVFRQNMDMGKIFEIEHIMYNEILPRFAELENEAGLPKTERLRFATCYGSSLEYLHEIILLEDLNVSDFVMLDRFKSLTSDTVKLVLKNFAMLHGFSYVLKKRDPESFEQFCKKLIEPWDFMANVPQMQAYMVQLEKDTITALDKGEYKKLVNNSISQMFSNISKNVKFYQKMNYSVIAQGDAWTNNIMFKMDGDKAVECCMIDYQLSNQNSPVADIVYMIYNCTDYETRSKHYHEWIDYYHNELDKRLANFGLKANDYYSRDRLDADLWRQRKIALGQALMGAGILMRDHEEAAKAKAKANTATTVDNAMQDMFGMSGLGADSMKRYKDKVEGLLKTFIELGYK